jgi:hypothetical protein
MPRFDPLVADLPPLLVDVIRAAAHAAQRDPRATRRGEAEALVELGRLARLAVPAHGVLAPVEPELCQSIHTVAVRHLGYGRASRSLRAGLDRVSVFHQRDAIEIAHAAMLSVTSVAYYYSGFAFGVTCGDRSGRR